MLVNKRGGTDLLIVSWVKKNFSVKKSGTGASSEDRSGINLPRIIDSQEITRRRISCIINRNPDETANGHQSRTPLIKSQTANSFASRKTFVRESLLHFSLDPGRETGICDVSPVEGENIPERDMDHGSPDTVPLQQIDRPVPLRAAPCAVRAHTRPPADN